MDIVNNQVQWLHKDGGGNYHNILDETAVSYLIVYDQLNNNLSKCYGDQFCLRITWLFPLLQNVLTYIMS